MREQFDSLFTKKAELRARRTRTSSGPRRVGKAGWWSTEDTIGPSESETMTFFPIKRSPEFDGDPGEFPFHFLPFASQMFYDGSLAHLPWMQESPDPLSTVMWGTWIEINPRTAEKLAIKQGDLVEVASQHGTLRAPALLTPGIAPDVVAMPIGQGHENFTRYASGRGANPIAIPRADDRVIHGLSCVGGDAGETLCCGSGKVGSVWWQPGLRNLPKRSIAEEGLRNDGSSMGHGD